MQVLLGSTRLVLLIGSRAVKIGRFRPIRLGIRLITLPFSSRKSFYRGGGSFRSLCFTYAFAGLVANKKECRHFQETRDPDLMPTTSSMLWGWINIQVRGTAHAWDREHCYHPNGHLVRVDYADDHTIDTRLLD